MTSPYLDLPIRTELMYALARFARATEALSAARTQSRQEALEAANDEVNLAREAVFAAQRNS